VDISSREEPACQKDSAPEAPEDFLASVSTLVALQDPNPKALEGLATPADAPAGVQGLHEPIVAASVVSSFPEGPAIALSIASLSPEGAHLQEPTAASSAVTPPSERMRPQEPTIASPTVTVLPPEKTRPQEPIIASSVVATPPRTGMFYHQIIFVLFCVALLTCLTSGPEPLGIARV
jgi:hypothetical protein